MKILAIEAEARAYLADAMREPSESYAPIFSTYVAEGVPTGKAGVEVGTAITAIAFAIMAERASTAEGTMSQDAACRLAGMMGCEFVEQSQADIPCVSQAAVPPGPCFLCAGKCRGHGLADPVAWEPEVGSVAAHVRASAVGPIDPAVCDHGIRAPWQCHECDAENPPPPGYDPLAETHQETTS